MSRPDRRLVVITRITAAGMTLVGVVFACFMTSWYLRLIGVLEVGVGVFSMNSSFMLERIWDLIEIAKEAQDMLHRTLDL